MAPRLTTMDRIYLAIIASAILLVLGVAGLFVIRTADLMPHGQRRPIEISEMSPPERYLIWSFEHRAWRGPGRVGYTTATHRAGIYTAEEANEICNAANRTAIEDFMVPAPSQSQI